VKESTFTVRDGEFFLPARAVGLAARRRPLRMIAGLELPTSGQIFLGNEDVTFKARLAPRHRIRVPAVSRCNPHNERCGQTSRSRSSRRACRAPRSRSAWPTPRATLRITELLDQAGPRPVERRPPARGPRPRDRAPAARLHDDEPLGALDSEFAN